MSYLIPTELDSLIPSAEHSEEVRVKRGYKGKSIGMWNKDTLISQATACNIPDERLESDKCSLCSAQLLHLNNPHRVIPVGYLEPYQMTPKDVEDICIALRTLSAELTVMNYLQIGEDSFKPGDESGGDRIFFLDGGIKICYHCVVKHFQSLVSIVKSL